MNNATLKLRNFVSQLYSQRDVAEKFLNFFELATKKFDEFRLNVYVEKKSYLADRIVQFKLLQVDFIPETKDKDLKTVNTQKENPKRHLE